MIGSELRAELETKLGSGVVEASSLPVGFGLTGLRIALPDTSAWHVKASQAGEGAGSHLGARGLQCWASLRAFRSCLSRRSTMPNTNLPRHGLHRDRRQQVTESVQRHAGELISETARNQARAGSAMRATRRSGRCASRTLCRPAGCYPLPRPSPAVAWQRRRCEKGACRCRCLPRRALAGRLNKLLIDPAYPSLLVRGSLDRQRVDAAESGRVSRSQWIRRSCFAAAPR